MATRFCARCGRKLKDQETPVYSRFTKSWYCGPRGKSLCDKNAKKEKKGS